MRSYLPGACFHLKAYVNAGAPRFDNVVRDGIRELLPRHLRASGTKPIAFTILPHELHLLIVQGTVPLGELMQPLLQRTAALVQRTHGCCGYVFGGRFKDQLCADVARGILWIHWLPVHAGMVTRVADYAWSSHSAYADPSAASNRYIDAAVGLAWFGAEQPRGQYRARIRRRCELHDFPGRTPARAENLSADAAAALRSVAPDCDLAFLRARIVAGHALSRIRREVIVLLSRRGHRAGDIATFFSVSATLVSQCARAAVRPSDGE